MMRQLILGTAGHIDHGKTALVRALTGVDTDRLPEEKRRGITIDIGFAHLELGEVRFGIVDVPGHERFIRNMLAGAAGVDLAMLVIAADDSIMPQTSEHLAILELLKIPAGLVVLTKCDLVEKDWIDLVEEDARTLVRGTFLDGAPIVRTSASRGVGIDELKRALSDLAQSVRDRHTEGGFRLPVDRSFVLGGLGTVVTGTVWSGAASVGDEIDWLPSGRKTRIRGLQSYGSSVETVAKGQRAALNLIGVHHSEITRGHELASPLLLKSSRRITAHVRVLKDSPIPVRHRARVRVHLGTQEVLAGVRLLRGTVLEAGESGIIQLISSQPFISRGRQPLIIRAESPLVTLGGGMVLQCVAGRLSRRDTKGACRAEDLLSEDESSRAEAAAYFLGARDWTAADLACELDIDPQRAASLMEQLIRSGRLVRLALLPRRGLCIHVDHCKRLELQVVEAMRKLHQEAPIEPAIPRPKVLQRLRYVDSDLLSGILTRLTASNKVIEGGSGVALRDHAGRLTAAQEAARERIVESFERQAFMPSEPADLGREFSLSSEEVRQLLSLCVHQGVLAHVSATIYLHEKWHQELHQRIRKAFSGGASLTMAEIRDLLETSRKYALPMCEYLDRIGLTRRQGDLRVAGPGLRPCATIDAERSAESTA